MKKNDLLLEAINYLDGQFPLEIRTAGDVSQYLPFQLRERTGAFKVSINGVQQLIICIDDIRILEINNYFHLKWIITNIPESIIIASRQQIQKNTREVMKNGGIGWIVPKKSINIPSMYINGEYEKISQKDIIISDTGTIGVIPTYIIAYYVSGNIPDEFTGEKISKMLDISKMSSSRAISNLLDEDLISYVKIGREKLVKFNYPKKTTLIKTFDRLSKISTGFTYGTLDEINNRDIFISGESALSKYSLLSEPSIKQYGTYLTKDERYKKTISEKTIKSAYLFNAIEIGMPRKAKAESNILVQIFPYKPIIKQGLISEIFLILSNTITRDIRVKSSLEEMKISIINNIK